MAKGYTNSVPLGRAGTGAATVLGDSQALNAFLENMEYNKKMGLYNLQKQQDYKASLNKSYRDNAIKAENGMLFNGELNGIIDNHVRKGAEYRGKGFDVYNPDPNRHDQMAAYEDYMSERAKIQSMMDLRKSHEKHYMDQMQEFQKGGYDEDSLNAVNDYYQDTGSRLQEIFESGGQLPMLQKAFDANGFMQKIKPTGQKYNTIKDNVNTTVDEVNMAATRFKIEESIMRDPQGKRWVSKQLGFDPSELVGTIDPAEVKSYLNDYYRSPDGAKEALKIFGEKGTVPSYDTQEFDDFLNTATKAQLAKEDKYEDFMENLTAQKAADYKTERTSKYDFTLENQGYKRAGERRAQGQYGMAVDKHRMAVTRFNERGDEKAGTKEEKERQSQQFRKEFIKGVQTGSTDYVQLLRKQAKAKGGNVGFYENGDLWVRWIGKDSNGNPKGQIEKRIEMSDANDRGYAGINEVLNDLTGKKHDIETLSSTDEYEGGLVDIGNVSLGQEEIDKLRNSGLTAKQLGNFFVQKKYFRSYKDAFLKASELLDKKGKIYKAPVKK